MRDHFGLRESPFSLISIKLATGDLKKKPKKKNFFYPFFMWKPVILGPSDSELHTCFQPEPVGPGPEAEGVNDSHLVTYFYFRAIRRESVWRPSRGPSRNTAWDKTWLTLWWGDGVVVQKGIADQWAQQGSATLHSHFQSAKFRPVTSRRLIIFIKIIAVNNYNTALLCGIIIKIGYNSSWSDSKSSSMTYWLKVISWFNWWFGSVLVTKPPSSMTGRKCENVQSGDGLMDGSR